MRYFRFFGVCALFGVFVILVASVVRGHYINVCICGLAVIFAWMWHGDVQAGGAERGLDGRSRRIHARGNASQGMGLKAGSGAWPSPCDQWHQPDATPGMLPSYLRKKPQTKKLILTSPTCGNQVMSDTVFGGGTERAPIDTISGQTP